MKIRNKFPPLSIHPTLWFSIIASILTGTLVEMMLIFSIVLIHELGHYLAAVHYGWKVRRIMLWMFGGVMETDEHVSKPLREECIITLAGPFQHVIIFILLISVQQLGWLNPSLLALGFQYNTTILLFNLLPIWPLDGGKLAFITLSTFLPFRKAHAYTIVSSILFISIILIVLLTSFSFILSTVLLFTFILWENRLEWKQRFYVFMRFLLKRFETEQVTKKVFPLVVTSDMRLIDVFSKFHRQYRHDIFIKDDWHVMDEATCLHIYFKLKQHQATIKEVSQGTQK
ncbi:site-2 protease family protein [Paraliobacillus zengyii]|uniref:site-2 protease family protein n=1 Tax=Paraliobacillus zengyii TaxID=2213194 RepID=UPI000DD4B262|nr:site-2 protease family protein [Paraliobacillus zengyii]